MKKEILRYIDFEKVNTLLEGFNKSTGFVTAILDLEGNILSKSGWRKVCTHFHRVNIETSRRCTISDTILAGKLARGEKYHFYQCLNGLVDVAVPVIIKGEHIANLFSGQFFFEDPNEEYFKKQAVRFGFNEAEYLEAVRKVPVITEENVRNIMEFLLNMTHLISDMTFQKLELMELNNSLRTSEERYRLVLENSLDAILLTSSDGAIHAANPAACKMFQLSEEEILKVGRNDLVNTNDMRLQALIEERNRTGKAKGELLMVRKDRTSFPVELSTSIFTDQEGNVRSSMIIRDITERKNAEEQLIIAKEKAEESDRLKTAFLQNMSHEIRTPMNAIMGFSELIIQQVKDDPKLEKYARIINHRCEDLLAIINDILEISLIESGKLPVNFESIDIPVLFEEISDFFTGHNVKQNKDLVSFVIKSPIYPLPNTIVSDKVKLKQILVNLISNACKFTEKGVIECGCLLNEEKQLVFYVSDTGIGIPKDKHEFIFERFAQVESAKYGGTGLGLPIVKGLLKLLGGEIWLDSEPGLGSTFWFMLNADIPANPNVKPLTKSTETVLGNCGNKTILIVEDDHYNAEFIREVFTDKDIKLFFALTGKEAIRKTIELNPDLVLMDIGLPDMSGYEVINALHKLRPGLKIISQTAFAAGEDREKALRAGCVDYISKPYKVEVLINMITGYI